MNAPDGPTRQLHTALEGRYRVERELGEGGMATVYLAEDLKHERRVAIKVLRPELAAVIGAERFLAEIKTTAKLQHPHILPLFDSGDADGFLYYVMPYVEGDNLRDRIEREGQLGVEDAVRITMEVADALDYAHRNGIIHRDIKPANILLHDGRPVVADFGIALAISAAGGGRMTETGLSLGTPHYMSPEQASADRDLNARSDVYSLGCVLYEMLAGQPPHTGPSAQSVLVRILTEEPTHLSELRRTAPPNVAAAVMKAIEKLPADRFHSASELGEALEDPTFRYDPAPRAAAASPGRAAPADATGCRSPWGPWLSDTRSRVAVGLVALLALALGLVVLDPDAPPSEATGDPPVRALLDLGDLTTSNPQWAWVNISPDGSRFAVLRDADGGDVQVYHRTASDMEFRPLPGAEGQIINMAFSPDGEWLAYATTSGLMRVSLLGGQPTQLVAADSLQPFLVDWGVEGWIAFWTFDEHAIYRVPDTGGPVERLVGPPEWDADSQPALLPDGSGLLFHDSRGRIVLYDFDADSARVLIPSGLAPRYVHSGHVVYADAGGGLWAVPFDLEANEVTGDPKPALQGVVTGFRVASFSVSRNGTLVYTAGPPMSISDDRRIVVAGTDGSSSVLDLPPRFLSGLRWAPDERRIAFHGGEPGDDPQALRSDIYIYDTEVQNAPTRLTNQGDNGRPVFSPDGSRIVFSSIREGTDEFDLFIRNLDDDAPPELLISLPDGQYPTDWPTDSLIVMSSGSAALTVTLDGDTATYYAPDANVARLRVAPNGHLATYQSDESGEWEVYIRAFPEPRIETVVSSHPGQAAYPWWSDDGRTLYYQTLDTLWAADIEVEPTPTVLRRRPLFATAGQFFQDVRGGRLLGTVTADAGPAREAEDEPLRYVVIHDWFTQLERIFEDDR